MIITLGYAKQKLAKFVDSGKCVDNPVVVDRINEAIDYLLGIEDWKLTVQRMRFYTSRNMIVLPYFAERLVAARPDISMDDNRGRNVGRIFSRTYEFLEGGPLTALSDASGLQALTDMGDGYPTMFEIDTASSVKLACFSTESADVGKVMEIRGATTNEHDLLTGGTPGFFVRINRWKSGIEGDIDVASFQTSAKVVKEVTHVVKPITTGYVTLLAFDPATNKTWILAKYHPQETVPGFHKYKVLNPDCTNGTCWTALVKMRYVPAVYDNDPLLIQNMAALKGMILALREQDAGNLEKKIAHTKDVLWLLKQQMSIGETKESEFTISDGFGMGDIY
jgi:hypothetical protein